MSSRQRLKTSNDDSIANKGLRSKGDFSIQDLTLLDLFPYNPSYSFNGFRSLIGVLMSLWFLFAVLLRVVTTSIEFHQSNPWIVSKNKPIEELDEDLNLQNRMTIGVKLSSGGQVINDNTMFKIHLEQGILAGPNRVRYNPLTNSTGEITTTSGLITYRDLTIVGGYINPADINEGYLLRGDLPLPIFKFVRIRVEQCRNTTRREPDFSYSVTGSTTGGPGVPCAGQAEIDEMKRNANFEVLAMETQLDPDSWDHVSEFLFMLERQFRSGVFMRHQFFVQVTKVDHLSRYILDENKHNDRYFKIVREDESVSDESLVVEHDLEQHHYLQEYVFRLERVFVEELRDHISIYAMFESWSASGLFFALVFGLSGWLYNRHSFRQQTKGLDIRKMDKDQFDKYGRLVDKSFQMPRELQDMQAE